MPSQTQVMRAPPALLESDSEDDEVLFTKEMLRQLTAKAKDLQNTRPSSSLSDSGMSSASTVTEDRIAETGSSSSNSGAVTPR